MSFFYRINAFKDSGLISSNSAFVWLTKPNKSLLLLYQEFSFPVTLVCTSFFEFFFLECRWTQIVTPSNIWQYMYFPSLLEILLILPSVWIWFCLGFFGGFFGHTSGSETSCGWKIQTHLFFLFSYPFSVGSNCSCYSFFKESPWVLF